MMTKQIHYDCLKTSLADGPHHPREIRRTVPGHVCHAHLKKLSVLIGQRIRPAYEMVVLNSRQVRRETDRRVDDQCTKEQGLHHENHPVLDHPQNLASQSASYPNIRSERPALEHEVLDELVSRQEAVAPSENKLDEATALQPAASQPFVPAGKFGASDNLGRKFEGFLKRLAGFPNRSLFEKLTNGRVGRW
jgi:hypothetical protein